MEEMPASLPQAKDLNPALGLKVDTNKKIQQNLTGTQCHSAKNVLMYQEEIIDRQSTALSWSLWKK